MLVPTRWLGTMGRLVLLVCAATVPSANAHEWNRPHHDEYLNAAEAEALGFKVEVRSVRHQGSPAVSVWISYPPVITGEPLGSGDLNEGCGLFDSNIEVKGDSKPYANYAVSLTSSPDCLASQTIWARYGSTFYYINIREQPE